MQAMYSWPRPMVYLPLGTPSKTSSSSSEMHYNDERGRRVSGLALTSKSGRGELTRRGNHISIARMPTFWGRVEEAMMMNAYD